MGNGQPKNEFRDEVKQEGKSPIQLETERVGEPEMLRRDQYATMRQLRLQKAMRIRDAAHLQAGIKDYEKLLSELSELPLSDAREGIVVMATRQIEALQKQKVSSKFPRPSEVTLASLEAVFAATEVPVDTAVQ